MHSVDPDALYEAAEARLDRRARPAVSGISDEDYAREEYEVLREALADPLSELYCERSTPTALFRSDCGSVRNERPGPIPVTHAVHERPLLARDLTLPNVRRTTRLRPS